MQVTCGLSSRFHYCIVGAVNKSSSQHARKKSESTRLTLDLALYLYVQNTHDSELANAPLD